MSDTGSNALYDLIKSLSGPEKRYFKLFASRHVIGDSNIYTGLFDLIEGQGVYDENKLFDVNKKIKKEQIHNIKKYLYDIILKSLNSFHANDSADTQLKYLVHQIKLLYEKGLYDQAKKIIRKAKRIATLYELYPICIELIYWERAIINNTIEVKKIGNCLAAVAAEEKQIIERMLLLNEIKAIQDEIYSIALIGKGRMLNEKMSTRQRKLERIMLLEKTGKLTFNMYVFLYNSCVLYYRAMGNAQKHYYFNKKLAAIHDASPERAEQNVDRYLSVLHNFLIASEEYDKKEIPGILKKLKIINATNPKVKRSILMQARIFQMTSMAEMELLIARGEFKQGITLIEKNIQSELEKYTAIIPSVFKWHLYYCMAYVYFGGGKPNEALKWLNKVLNNPGADLKQDVATAARLLNLMSHLELKNTDHLHYILKSTSRFLNKKVRISKIEVLVLNQFKKIIRSSSSGELRQIFISFKNQLLELKESERSIFTFIDIPSWIEGKIVGKSFMEAVKEKVYKQDSSAVHNR